MTHTLCLLVDGNADKRSSLTLTYLDKLKEHFQYGRAIVIVEHIKLVGPFVVAVHTLVGPFEAVIVVVVHILDIPLQVVDTVIPLVPTFMVSPLAVPLMVNPLVVPSEVGSLVLPLVLDS